MPPPTNPASIRRTEANVPLEIELLSERERLDPFNEVLVILTVTDPTGKVRKVPAFWAGGETWKARYASPLPGSHHWRAEASDSSDPGLHGPEGTFEITPYTGDNPLFKHGPVVAKPGQRHLEHADGTPFFWLGDTWWTGLSHRLQWPKEYQMLANDRAAKGFNVVQLVAGLYPDMHPFDPRGANEAGFPWEEHYARIRPAYFDAVDLKLRYLVESGITPCLVGAWGYFLPWLGPDKMKAHWRNLIARYAAWPVVWCAAGEANLPWYLVEKFPYHDARQVTGWTEILRYIRETDPFRRPLTIHPTGLYPPDARHSTDDPSLLDFDFLQTPHAQRDGVPVTVRAVRESYAAVPVMPVINGEPAYEMLFDRLGSEWSRAMFWLCLTNGTKGHTYGANGLWQLNRPGDPHGPSPHTTGTGYGVITWEEAMRLPVSQQVAWGRKFMETLPWTELTPMPESVRWAEPSLANWIWAPAVETEPGSPADRYFRRRFEVPAEARVRRATLTVSAADKFTVWLNGEQIRAEPGDLPPRPFRASVMPQPGANVLAVQTESTKSPFVGNSAAFAATLEMEIMDGAVRVISTDETWRASPATAEGWQNRGFDDSTWSPVPMGAEDILLAPQACGVGARLRLIYAFEGRPIVVRDLAPLGQYDVKHFDPVKGSRSTSAARQADAQGEACFPAPDYLHDWVLLLEQSAPSPAEVSA